MYACLYITRLTFYNAITLRVVCLSPGGAGGRGRTLWGGDGNPRHSLSGGPTCLGGGPAGQTISSSIFCCLSSTSCLYCGTGGAKPDTSSCDKGRVGGCGGRGSQRGEEAGAGYKYGGGATGVNNGGGGGGGGFSRKLVRVSPRQKISVKVGHGGHPSAVSAAGGVVVVGWGDRLDNLLDMVGTSERQCQAFAYPHVPSTLRHNMCY